MDAGKGFDSIFETVMGQTVNDISVVGRAMNHAFATNNSIINFNQARVGEVLAKRIGELDIAEGRGMTAIDPVSQTWHLNNARTGTSAVGLSDVFWLEYLRQAQQK